MRTWDYNVNDNKHLCGLRCLVVNSYVGTPTLYMWLLTRMDNTNIFIWGEPPIRRWNATALLSKYEAIGMLNFSFMVQDDKKKHNLPKNVKPSPKAKLRAFVSLTSVSERSIIVWSMVDVTSPLHVPMATKPQAMPAIPITCKTRCFGSTSTQTSNAYFMLLPYPTPQLANQKPCMLSRH